MADNGNLQIFCAALQGIIASGALKSQPCEHRAEWAVDFARTVVRAAHNNNPNSFEPDTVGKPEPTHD